MTHVERSAYASACAHRGILTLGEWNGLAGDGGIIGVTILESRARFEINAVRSVLGAMPVDSKFLTIARIVGTSQSVEAE